MHASSFGLAAAILLTLAPIESANAGAALITRHTPGLFHHRFAWAPEFGRPERRDGRLAGRRHPRFFPEAFGGGAGDFEAGDLPDPAGQDFAAYAPGDDAVAPSAPSAPAAPTTATAMIVTAPPAADHRKAAFAPASGPKIITIAAPGGSSRFANMPLVVYGRPPVNPAF